MSTGVLLVLALAALSFGSGLAGGKRVLASIVTPAVLVLLSIVANHSEIVALPEGTAVASTFAWLFGFLMSIIAVERRAERSSAAGAHDHQHSPVRSGGPTPR